MDTLIALTYLLTYLLTVRGFTTMTADLEYTYPEFTPA